MCLHSNIYSLSCHGGVVVVFHKHCRTARVHRTWVWWITYTTGIGIMFD